MDFQDFLRERLQKQYTHQLFKMIPVDLHNCLKKVITMRFTDEPPYERIDKCLQVCFEKSILASIPKSPISSGMQQ